MLPAQVMRYLHALAATVPLAWWVPLDADVVVGHVTASPAVLVATASMSATAPAASATPINVNRHGNSALVMRTAACFNSGCLLMGQ